MDVTIPSAVSGVEHVGVSRLLEQEARIVGIKDFSSPTLEAVDRRMYLAKQGGRDRSEAGAA